MCSSDLIESYMIKKTILISFIKRILPAALSLMVVYSVSAQDIVVLENGDKITGEVIEKTSGNLKIKTKYAGEVTVLWKHVKILDIKKKVNLSFGSKEKYFATMTMSENGSLQIMLDDGKVVMKNKGELKSLEQKVEQNNNQKLVKSGRVKVSANATSGNTETGRLNLDIEGVFKKGRDRLTLGVISDRATENKKKTLSNNRASGKYDHYFGKKKYWQTNAQYQENKFKGINSKLSTGVGTGYDIWSGKKKNLALEGGVNYVNEDIQAKKNNEFAAFRWAIKYDQKIFNSKAKFFHKQEGLLDLEVSENVTLNSQTGVSVPITKKIETSAQVNMDFDNTPAAGKEDTELIYMFSVGYKW